VKKIADHLILGLDIATVTGYAIGAPGTVPRCGYIRFGEATASANSIFGAALSWFSDFLKEEPRPTMIMLESMLPMAAMKGETHRQTRDRLAGLHGVLRAVAFCRGIHDIGEIGVIAVRQHFCGAANAGKHGVYERCRMLGWPVNDLNASDAAAIWSYACGIVRPDTAISVTPLFHGRPYRVTAGAGS
jgi:hypothetical protein